MFNYSVGATCGRLRAVTDRPYKTFYKKGT